MTIPNLGFLYFWGIVFFISTTLVWILKKEQQPKLPEEDKHEVEHNLTIIDTYKLLIKIFKLPAIKWTVVILLTCKVSSFNLV